MIVACVSSEEATMGGQMYRRGSRANNPPKPLSGYRDKNMARGELGSAYGAVTQLGECLPCKQKVESSNLFGSTRI